MTTVAERLVETLEAAGVTGIYGLVGDSLNGITDALRGHKSIPWIPVRHEEVAAFAAGAEAQLTGKLAVCAGSCGPGNLHLINGLFDCHRTRVPVLAIAAHIPSTEVGSGYFQETHPQILFKECSHYAELITDASQVPRIVETAIREAVTKQGVAVIVISGDTAMRDAGPQKPSPRPVPRLPNVVPADADVDALAALINEGKRVTLMCGAGCAGAHDEVVALAAKLQAPVVHALRGKEHVEWDNPFDVGMTGLIGFSSGYYAMMACDTLLLLGTDFPYRQFYPEKARIAQIDIRGESLGKRCRLELGVIGDVRETLKRLDGKLKQKTDAAHLDQARTHYKKARADLDDLAVGHAGRTPIHPQFLAKVISDAASEDAVVTCDVGEPTVWAARYLRVNGKRRLIGSFLHGSMANAMPQAIGAQVSHPGRQVISMSGDGGFTMLMGDLLTVRHLKLPVKIVIFNNSLLGFVDIEMKAAGFLPTGTHLDNPNFAKMAEAIGIYGVRVEDPADLVDAVKQAFAHDGPAVIDVVTDPIELVMPPKITVEQAKGFSIWMMKSVLNGQGNEIVELARTAFGR
ncbi:ubiquinone-dependent pyruvate dehydrogenase [Dyella sp. Tek66A03]|uniref:ubiquinone-dependent pyruvate dehydrogenase n=1 Tax=Dyella sp. Tek66A03 TaxID=3458298 RepID=UPI00403EE64B